MFRDYFSPDVRLTERSNGLPREGLRPQLCGHLQHVAKHHRLVAVVTHGAGEEHLLGDHVAVHHIPVHLVLHVLTGARKVSGGRKSLNANLRLTRSFIF